MDIYGLIREFLQSLIEHNPILNIYATVTLLIHSQCG
ncbi:hypothetical protein T08_10519 [Trichinella sp. T8]|nr:hypothetical protein T08_10519 [Trichinella sp. T8]